VYTMFSAITAMGTVSSSNRNRNNKRDRPKYILDTGSTHTTVKDNRDLTNLFKSDTIDYAYQGTLMPFDVKAQNNKCAATNI